MSEPKLSDRMEQAGRKTPGVLRAGPSPDRVLAWAVEVRALEEQAWVDAANCEAYEEQCAGQADLIRRLVAPETREAATAEALSHIEHVDACRKGSCASELGRTRRVVALEDERDRLKAELAHLVEQAGPNSCADHSERLLELERRAALDTARLVAAEAHGREQEVRAELAEKLLGVARDEARREAERMRDVAWPRSPLPWEAPAEPNGGERG